MLYKKARRSIPAVYWLKCKELFSLLHPRGLTNLLIDGVKEFLRCEIRELPQYLFGLFVSVFIIVTIPFLFWFYAGIATCTEWRKYKTREMEE